MPFLRKFFALLLVLAWLPATMHCLAEEMGALTDSQCICLMGDAGHVPMDAPHHSDCGACFTFERALTKAPLVAITVAVPAVRDEALTAALLAPFSRPAAELPPALEDSPPPLAERFSRTVSLLI